MAEVIRAFLSTEARQERANCSPDLHNCSRLSATKEFLEFAANHLDRVEVGGIFRQVPKRRSSLFDDLANAGTGVRPAVVDDDDVTASQCWAQTLLQIGQKHLSGHGSLKGHRSSHFVVPHRSYERDCLPGSKRNATDHSHPPRSAPSERTMLVVTAVSSRNTSLAGSSRPCSRIQRRRARATSARPRSAACKLFFKGDVVPVKKPRERAAAGSNAISSELCNSFFQGQVRLVRDHRHDMFGLPFHWRNATSSWLRRGAPTLIPALHPLDYRTHTDAKMVGSCRDAPASTISITRSRRSQEYDFGIATPRVRESMLEQWLIHIPLGIHRFKSAGSRFKIQQIRGTTFSSPHPLATSKINSLCHAPPHEV
jgi:hypothetical protein